MSNIVRHTTAKPLTTFVHGAVHPYYVHLLSCADFMCPKCCDSKPLRLNNLGQTYEVLISMMAMYFAVHHKTQSMTWTVKKRRDPIISQSSVVSSGSLMNSYHFISVIPASRNCHIPSFRTCMVCLEASRVS